MQQDADAVKEVIVERVVERVVDRVVDRVVEKIVEVPAPRPATLSSETQTETVVNEAPPREQDIDSPNNSDDGYLSDLSSDSKGPKIFTHLAESEQDNDELHP